MRPVSIRKIRAVAQKIGKQLQPKKIILFGSYAYGHPNADSDVDFFIITPSRKRPVERAVIVSRLLHPRPFPVDILVRTPQEVRKRLTSYFCPFTQEVMKKGKVLYEGKGVRL